MKTNKLIKAIVVIFISSWITSTLNAQTLVIKDAEIEKAVEAVSADNLKTYVQQLVSFHNRNNLSSTTDKNKGIGAAAEYLYQKVMSFAPASGGRLTAEKIYYDIEAKNTRLDRDVTLCNVVATIKGSNVSDNRVIAVLAHYDNRGSAENDSLSFVPGANDNGSGVACLLEMTRLLSTIELPVTIKLMFLSGEEHGLFGARHMAQLAKNENWNLIAVINNDMIGNSNASETNTHTNTVVRIFSENIPATETEEERRIRVYNSAENDSPSRQLARYIKEIGERYVENITVKLMYRNDRFGRSGDHTPFSREGFTAVRVCETHENYDRTHVNVFEKDGINYGDVIEAIDFEYVRKNTAVNLAAVANLALAPSVPQNVKLDVSGLGNYTLLTWQPPQQGEKPAAYYVLMRETDQSQWERKIMVHDTKIKLPYSKDNYFYAVQSIDRKAHESLPVFAKGQR